MRSRYRSIIDEKLAEFYEQGIPAVFERDVSLGDVLEPARSNLVKVLVGVRRCGKTYRLYQEMHRILNKGYDLKSILYFNFDDERLKPYETEVLNDVIESYFAMRPQAKSEGAFFFFDEIQEIPDWGTFMRRMVDTQKATIYITGSSSKMLSAQLSSEFRGRSLPREIFPMSFSEFLRFHRLPISEDLLTGKMGAVTAAQKAQLRNSFDRYLDRGGFIPVQNLELLDAIQLLQEYANRTVNYDVIERYSFGNPYAASLFLARCIASSGRELSINKTFNEFKSRQVSVGRESLSKLLAYYEESYLLFSVRNYSSSLSDNARSSVKVYAADPALFSAFSPAPALDTGQRLETAVFNKLRRDKATSRIGGISKAIVNNGGRHEIDFVVGDALALEQPKIVQVCVDIGDGKTREREISSLETAMRQFQVNESWLVTIDDEEDVESGDGIVHIVPAWKWLL